MEKDIRQTDTTGLDDSIENYSIEQKPLDSPQGTTESYYYNQDFQKNNGAYKTIPEYKKAIDTYALYVLGNGITSEDAMTRVILDHLDGFGKDTPKSIFMNLLRMKKINGDSYAECIRDSDSGILINLKPLNPEKVIHVLDSGGRIIGYDYVQSDGTKKRLKPEDIFHLCNDRVGDEKHGVSVRECVEWVIEARQEAMADFRRVAHRATIRVLYIDEDDKTRYAELKASYADAIKKGELLILPGKPNDAGFQDLTLPPMEAYVLWIQYLENFFYQAVGVPKAVTGGTMNSTEAASKVGLVSFDPIYQSEMIDLQNDIWQQLGLKVSLMKQPSMMDNVQSNEAKNTQQTKLQMQGAQ